MIGAYNGFLKRKRKRGKRRKRKKEIIEKVKGE